MADKSPNIIFGSAGIASFSAENQEQLLSVLQKHNVKYLDTAFIYPNSEATLGKIGWTDKFTIHTKAPGWSSGALAKKSVLDGAEKSLKELGTDCVEIYYLHSPDPSTPIAETLSAIDEIYAAGKFKKFGLSNFSAAQVQEIYDIQSKNKSVLPTVFQGNYNAVSRHIESDLFPLLRKLGISFNAYSPIAGGFLVKSAEQFSGIIKGRWDKTSPFGDLYNSLYAKESLINALNEWAEIAEEAGISKAALAYRWIAYHSAVRAESGDGVIIGASKIAQLEESLTAIEQGPLDQKIAERVDAIWKKVEMDAPVDNFESYAKAKLT